jgi:hypothetical protein
MVIDLSATFCGGYIISSEKGMQCTALKLPAFHISFYSRFFTILTAQYDFLKHVTITQSHLH